MGAEDRGEVGRKESRKDEGSEIGFDNIRNKVIFFFLLKTISKNNTFLILLAAVPDERGRTNCANT